MPTPPLSPTQRKLLDTLGRTINKVKSYRQMNIIKSWNDVFTYMGMAPDKDFTPEKLKLLPEKPELQTWLANILATRTAAIIATGGDKNKLKMEITSITEAAPRIDTTGLTERKSVFITEAAKEDATNTVATEMVDKVAHVQAGAAKLNDLGDDPDSEALVRRYRSPNCNVKLIRQQAVAVHEIYTAYKAGHRAVLLRGGTGVGKTFIAGMFSKILIDEGFLNNPMMFCQFPLVYCTKAAVVEQTNHVFEKLFKMRLANEIKVTNYDQLRSTFGKMFVDEEVVIESGQERISYIWKKHMNPWVIYWDECQSLRRTEAIQTQLGLAFSAIEDTPIFQIFSSATPFLRVSEAKYFCLALKLRYRTTWGEERVLTENSWNEFAAQVAAPADPTENSPPAMERLMAILKPYVVEVKGMRPQFKAKNRVMIINFRDESESKEYKQAWDKYQQKKALLESGTLGNGGNQAMMELAALNVFKRSAEEIRGPLVAEKMHELVNSYGKAAFSAWGYKSSIVRAVKHLVYELGVPRSKISIIWGGIGKTINKTRKDAVARLNDPETVKLLESMNLKLEDFGIDFEKVGNELALQEDPAIKELNLGPQNIAQRNIERVRYQSGLTDYCLFTLKAGGVGMSLHHSDDYTKQKVRRKESGYAVEEDIPLIPVKPRAGFIAPCYSAIELVQGMGRAPRQTSLSDTEQAVLLYDGTIEMDVAQIYSQKLKSLAKVVQQREDWNDVIVRGNGDVKRMTILDYDDINKKTYETDMSEATDAVGEDEEEE